MKKVDGLLILGFMLITSLIYGQRFTVDIGAGIGWAFTLDETRLPGGVIKTPLRGMINAGINYHPSADILVGFEASTALFIDTRFWSRSNEPNRIEDGTIIMDPLNFNSHNLALKGAYYFDYKGFRPYLATGIGINFNVALLDYYINGERQKLTTLNLSFHPEVGVEIDEFSIAVKSVIGGRTDAFEAVNERQETVMLESNRFLVFYLKGSYRFDLGKGKKAK